MLQNWRNLATVFTQTVVLWLAIAGCYTAVLSGFGLTGRLSDGLFLLGFGFIGSLLPTPGGAAGAYHLSTAAGLGFFAVGPSQAAGIAIILHLVCFAPAVFLAVPCLLQRSVSSSRVPAVETQFLDMQCQASDVRG